MERKPTTTKGLIAYYQTIATNLESVSSGCTTLALARYYKVRANEYWEKARALIAKGEAETVRLERT